MSAGTRVIDEETRTEICIYSREKESTCIVGVQVTLVGMVAGIAFLCTEYFMWRSASVKHRRRIIRTGLAVGGERLPNDFFWILYPKVS